ncbi:short-chain dehydrogenase [Altererythrobacter aerius]|uniref:Short-chain dehydrogenase n=2 Tax=Tsuneonella aeria TaxID=1837929 RepID=A0A6I4TFJ9_9SPHN|nr:short-chain dehydrogenase [Tsuneonella aeria]
MLALRRARMAAAPAFLRGGFRPFFLGGATWAIVALALWLAALVGAIALPTTFDPLAWHRHEMLFGFVGAVIAGFLLTAIPNWTGRLPIAGGPLLALALLWAAARAAVLFSAVFGAGVAALLDVGFYLVFAALAAREVVAGGNRNLPVVGVVALFALANAADHAVAAGMIADDGLGWRAGLALVVMLISIVGGRIVPSFTRNWLTRQGVREGLPDQPGQFDRFTLMITAAALLSWVAAPDGLGVGAALAVAAAMQALRLARWKGVRTLRDPLVAVLHVGYAWVPAGLALLSASVIEPAIPRTAAIHALTAGAMVTMILAVMTRATLGHTGRALRAGPATTALYALITLAALIRIAVPFDLVDYTRGLEISGLAWTAAFALFLAVYGPMLVTPRRGE